jgi:hypothetical protein
VFFPLTSFPAKSFEREGTSRARDLPIPFLRSKKSRRDYRGEEAGLGSLQQNGSSMSLNLIVSKAGKIKALYTLLDSA